MRPTHGLSAKRFLFPSPPLLHLSISLLLLPPLSPPKSTEDQLRSRTISSGVFLPKKRCTDSNEDFKVDAIVLYAKSVEGLKLSVVCVYRDECDSCV